MKFRGVTALCLIATLLGVNGCDRTGQNKSAVKKKLTSTHLVEILPVEKIPLRHTITRTGTLAASRVTKLFNQEEGRIDTVYVSEGDFVTRGQLLVKLDDRRLRAELAKAVAETKRSGADIDRVRKLAEANIASREKLLEMETAQEVAQADERLLGIRLSDTEITAPFAGVITERYAEEGDVAPLHTHLLTLLDRNSLYTEVHVSELLLPALSVKDKAEVAIDALGGGKVFPGEISRIHPTIDPHTRQGIVEVRLTKIPEQAAAGQLCRVTLKTPRIVRTVIPFASLRRDGEGQHVYIVEDGKALRRAVHSGLRIEDSVEILDGVEAGQNVVTRGFLGLSGGKKVEVVASRPVDATKSVEQ